MISKANKYGARKTVLQGQKFDSKREALRWLVLRDMERRGEIHFLERQPKFPLWVNGALICTYISDFRYALDHKGKVVVEDSKSPPVAKNPAFRIKFKLAQALYPDIEWKLS